MKECDVFNVRGYATNLVISIHALYERVRPSIVPLSVLGKVDFNPRTLWKSATSVVQNLNGIKIISIHALYERVRPYAQQKKAYELDFNPRTLWKSATLR